MNTPNENPAAMAGNRWYRQPIAWLGIAITLLILGGCIWTVSISLGYKDVSMHGHQPTLLGVPMPAAESSSGRP